MNGRTVLLLKTENLDNERMNYRHITSLNTCDNIFTEMITNYMKRLYTEKWHMSMSTRNMFRSAWNSRLINC